MRRIAGVIACIGTRVSLICAIIVFGARWRTLSCAQTAENAGADAHRMLVVEPRKMAHVQAVADGEAHLQLTHALIGLLQLRRPAPMPTP